MDIAREPEDVLIAGIEISYREMAGQRSRDTVTPNESGYTTIRVVSAFPDLAESDVP